MAQDSSDKPSLPLEIKFATQVQHTALNRLIIARLPLCLPPYTNNPNLYVMGIELFGRIYAAVEYPWEQTVEAVDESAAAQANRLQVIRSQLLTPKLVRREKLRHDFEVLSCSTGRRLDVLGVGSGRHDHDCRASEICGLLLEKPHLIMAYAWVMYMALFNGGRWMKGQFQKHGVDFWKDAGVGCLSFWDFEGDRDGEDVKEEFVGRFNELTLQLTEEEREEVVEEARMIFQMCTDMVGNLDDQVAEVVKTKSSSGDESQKSVTERLARAPAGISGLWTSVANHWIFQVKETRLEGQR